MQNLRASLSAILWAVVLTVAVVGCPAPEPPNGEGNGEGSGEMPVEGVAPGLVIEVEEVRIPSDRRPEVDFRIFDERGNAVPLGELTDARFILGYLEDPSEGDTARYVSYTVEPVDGLTEVVYDPARLDGITPNGDGTFRYKFEEVLAIDYPAEQTHQIAGQFRRIFPANGETYVYNLAETFQPDGGMPTGLREIVTTQTCNQCHTRLEAHGGVRRETQLCIMCHNQQSFDAQSGNSVDFATMIHKIHYGEELPSVQAGDPYQIVGFGGTVHDYSTVVYPQDIRNCASCHQGGVQSEFYKTQPTIAGCASCHDRSWFGDPDMTPMGFTNHTGGEHTTNRLCAQCHTATAPGVSPIDRAHLIPTESEAAPGLSFAVDAVRSMPVPSKQALTQILLDFTALNGAGEGIEDLSVLGSVAATIAYPAQEYETTVRETILGNSPGTLVNNGGGSYTYTFGNTIPFSGDTYAIAMEGRRMFEFREQTVTQGTSNNALTFFTLDESAPMPRREVVEEARCTTCHSEIRAHGGQRVGVGSCLLCHNANLTDVARRPSDELPPTSVHFKTMIHSIHMGEDLTNPFTIFGFGGTAHDFTEVRYPAPQQDCAQCHLPGTTDLPLPAQALSTLVLSPDDETIVSETLPETASCVSCHDTGLAAEHAGLNSNFANGVETCAVCHGPNGTFSVDRIHRD